MHSPPAPLTLAAAVGFKSRPARSTSPGQSVRPLYLLRPNATLGGLGLWNFSGAVVFQSGSTVDVTLNGTSPGIQYTQLVDSNTTAGVSLASPILIGSVDYQYEQGDLFTIISAPLVTGAFQNVVAGQVVLGDGVLFGASYSGTAVARLRSSRRQPRHSRVLPPPAIPARSSHLRPWSTHRGMSPVSAGAVSFLLGSTVLATVALAANGTATFSTSSLPLGSYGIIAVYNAAGPNLSSQSPALIQSVVPYTTVTSLAGSPNPSLLGQLVTLTASVTAAGAPVTVGTISFERGSQVLAVVPLTPSGMASASGLITPRGHKRDSRRSIAGRSTIRAR